VGYSYLGNVSDYHLPVPMGTGNSVEYNKSMFLARLGVTY
jgi:hypothetical protein